MRDSRDARKWGRMMNRLALKIYDFYDFRRFRDKKQWKLSIKVSIQSFGLAWVIKVRVSRVILEKKALGIRPTL